MIARKLSDSLPLVLLSGLLVLSLAACKKKEESGSSSSSSSSSSSAEDTDSDVITSLDNLEQGKEYKLAGDYPSAWLVWRTGSKDMATEARKKECEFVDVRGLAAALRGSGLQEGGKYRRITVMGKYGGTVEFSANGLTLKFPVFEQVRILREVPKVFAEELRKLKEGQVYVIGGKFENRIDEWYIMNQKGAMKRDPDIKFAFRSSKDLKGRLPTEHFQIEGKFIGFREFKTVIGASTDLGCFENVKIIE